MVEGNFDIIAYTDGACKGNPGVGGWGVVFSIEYLGTTQEYYGSEKLTTNNRMELTAAIEALELCGEEQKVLLYTDSQYLMKGITEWIVSWKKNGWKNSKREPVKNQDLWMHLDELCCTRDVTWRWVRGHNDNPGNERADQLANKAIIKLLRS